MAEENSEITVLKRFVVLYCVSLCSEKTEYTDAAIAREYYS